MQEIDPAQSVHHSARTKTVSYLVAEPNTITAYRHDLQSLNIDKSSIDDVRDYFALRTTNIKSDYQEYSKRNQKMQDKTKIYQEAVISFGREQFENCAQSEILKSIDRFCNNFENKYGCKVLMSSLHLDEGHKSKTGEILHNYHAHILVENYSFETHKTTLQKLDYRKLQTELANEFKHLGFERGQDYTSLQKAENQLAKEEHRQPKKIKPVRLEHREYRQMKEQEYELTRGVEALEQFLEPLVPVVKQLLKERPNADLKTLGTEVATTFTNTQTGKDQIMGLQEQLRLAKEQYDADRKKLKESGEAKQADYQKLKAEYEELKSQLESSSQQNDVLQAKVTTLENERLTKSFETFKPTFTREELDYAHQIEDTYKSLTLFSGNKHEITTTDPDFSWKTTTNVLTTKEVKTQYERLTQTKILAIGKLETRSNELAKALEKTTKQLESATESNEQLKDVNRKYWQICEENNVLQRENRTLKSIEGKEPQELQAKIVSQSEQIRALSSEKSSLEFIKEAQKMQINELKTENTALKTAIEHFLELPIIKPLVKASKTLLERFTDGLEGIKTAIDGMQSKNKQLDEALATEKNLSSKLERKIEYLEEYGVKPRNEREQNQGFER